MKFKVGDLVIITSPFKWTDMKITGIVLDVSDRALDGIPNWYYFVKYVPSYRMENPRWFSKYDLELIVSA